jgi:sugar phosphate isomerase/epimerase
LKLGVFTALYADLPLADTLERIAGLGLDAVELGTGNYPGQSHCDPDTLLADPRAARELRGLLDGHGLEISALSQHGNPLHPDQARADAAHAIWRKTLQLAELLEVPVVAAFAGCPGDRTGGVTPNWVVSRWPPEFAELLDWQWGERVVPYWATEAAMAARHGVRVAIEMHPGFVVYNPDTLLRLRAEAGDAIGVNFDPSHLFWQQVDPVTAVGELAGAILHVHAKDTRLDPRNVARLGVLDARAEREVSERPWVFRTVGAGHGEELWRRVVDALRAAGYDGTISIEHEDPLATLDDGLRSAVEVLRPIVH